MKWSRWALAVAAPLAVAGCNGIGQAMNAHNDQLARAAGKEFTVEEAASLLAANPQIEPTPDMVRAVADRWVDYVLLATALAEDTALNVLDLDKLVEGPREQATIGRLMEQVVSRADTSYTDAELQQAWNTQGPGVEVRARHILLQFPGDATPAQRDSVRRAVEAIRAQAAGGADFAALAQQHGQDGTKERGGDLGYFGKGQMVPAFENAVFAMQPGQISPVVETPFGYHVIKLEDRRTRPIGDDAPQFRQFLAQRAQQEAMQAYVDSLEKAAGVEVRPGATDQVRELARQPGTSLRGRAASRKLVTWKGGDLTTGELLTRMQSVEPEQVRPFAEAPDSSVTQMLKSVTTRELLLAEAQRRKIGLSKAEADTLQTQARSGLRELVQVTGLGARRIPKGAAGNQMIEGQVRELLQQAVTGQRPLPPLGVLGQQLRGIYGHNVNESVFQRVIDKVKSIRALQPQAPQLPQGMPQGGVPQGPPQQGQPQQAPQPAPAPQGQAQPQTPPAEQSAPQ
ncbi:MAG TPA: peptidylprolyl isomerase [Longimicrobium sp.]|nr:peptidylprolyl isomerase [Longimicrobium sp.]